jgi:ATP-binding cassette subfamily F protein 3
VLLRLAQIGRALPTRRLFGGVELEVRAGDRIGLVGPNGAGKTTLLRIAAELDSPDEGRVNRPRDIRVGLLRQEIDPGGSQSVREEASTAFAHLDALEAQVAELEREIERVGRAGASPDDALASRYDRARSAFELGGGFERGARVERVLAGLGFDDEDCGRPLHTFSGGWLMRVELAKLLLADPDVLLLDEPTNHLDLPSIEWFESTLTTFRGGVIAISHDRAFLRGFTNRVAELSRGRFEVWEMGWDRYLTERDLRNEQLRAAKKNQDRKIAETERFIERFRYKASKARQVQSRVKALDKIDRVELADDVRGRMRLRIPPAARAGDVAMTLEDVHKRYADTIVYRGVDLEIKRGDRVAMVGPNGAGKSTLLRILAGELPFDAGERRPGHNVRIAFYAQHQLEVLDAKRTVLEELASVATTEDIARLRGHLGAFLFSGDDVEKKVSVLSGGEKARLALARMLLRPANFLILDEPTNHLDVDACEVLETALSEYDGTLAVISHDRTFIDAIADRVVEVRAGRLREFHGNYSEYLRAAAARTAPDPTPGAVPGHGDRSIAAPPPTAPTAPVDKEARREQRRVERERKKARDRATRRMSVLEEEILDRETQLEQLGWKLGDPEVARDPDRIRTLGAERDVLKEEVDARYKEWERRAAEIDSYDQAETGEA